MAPVDQGGDVLDTPAAGGLVIRGGIVRVAGYGVGTLLALLSFSLITRHLGTARFGDYQTVLSLITIVSAITEAGMATLAVREYTTLAGEPRDRLMRGLLGIRLALTTAGVVAALVFAVAAGFDGALVAGTALAGVGVGLNVLQSMCVVPLTASLQITTATLLELGRQLVLVIVLVGAVVAGAGVVWLLGATIPAGLAALVATAVVVRGRMPLRPAFDPQAWPRLLLLTLPVALSMATGTLYVYFVQVVTELVTPGQQSGLFAASFRVFIVLGAIPGLVVSAAFPVLSRAARDDQQRLAYALDRLFATMLAVGALTSVAVGVGAPVAIDVIGGRGYEAAVPVLQIQAWALLASFVIAASSFALLSLRLHRQIVGANLLALVTSGVLTLTLAGGHGAKGAAAATVTGEAVLAAVTSISLYRARPDLRPPLGVVPKVALAIGASMGVTGLGGLPALPATAAAVIVCAGVLVATRAVPRELLEVVTRT